VYSGAACAYGVSVRKLPLISLRPSIQSERSFPCLLGRVRLADGGDIV
jgi:hypothetical protein